MKTHTSQFKENIALMGREIDSIITYGNTTLQDELYSVTPLFEGNILKSIMKQLDIESSVDIPKDTIINYQFGVKVGNNYEYLDFGNYVVVKSEKQEDLDRYKITCYDKMVYAMQQNEELQIQYPIKIKDYLNAIGNKIGLSVKDTNFYNADLYISQELYVGLEYTYRDILDEIAQATGSSIIINKDDELEVIYPNITGDTIDESYLKDINVTFKEKYGPINSIVISRAGESDNVYLRDEESVLENGLCEVKIVDNQIMNWNDRSDYLEGILNALDGLEYYINDFTSTGITYYDPLDIYNIQIGENIYKSLMLNDEINVTSGLKEIIHTEMPEESQTDYTKADKTDRAINKTYIIVDKQNQTIESVVSNVTTQNQKISRIEQTVDELNSKISDIADITVSKESDAAFLEFDSINQSEPIRIVVHPIVTNISYLYPRVNLYPSTSLFMPQRTIQFKNTNTNEIFTYTLPADLFYYDSDNYDELILDYDSQNCQINKKVGINADGTTYLLQTPVTIDYPYPTIALTDGDYEVSLLGYATGYLFVRLMAQNIYTTQFATHAELNSELSQTATQINLSVDTKLSNYSTTTQMNSAINLKANQITASVSETYETKDSAQTNYSTLTQTATSLQTQVSAKVGNNEVISKINQSAEQIQINANKISLAGKTINLTSDNIAINSTNFKVDKNGNLQCSNANISGTITATSGTFQNCTITNSCSVPASTVTGTLSSNNIPNLNASKITSGTISASVLEGVDAYFGILGASAVYAGNYCSAGLGFSCGYDGVGSAGRPQYVVFPNDLTGNAWTRLTFRGGICTAIDHEW